MVKRSIEQDLRNRNFGARHGNFETNAVGKNQETKQRKSRTQGDCWQRKANGQCSKTIAVSDTIRISVENRHSRILLRDLLRWMREKHREPEVPEAEAQVGKWLDCLARITSKELAQLHYVKNDILQNACSTSPTRDVNLEIRALTHTASLTNSLAKGLKRMVTKVQWLCWQVHDNWVAYVKIWSRRSLQQFCGRAQTYGNPSDVLNSQKPSYVMLTFETRIHRLEWFAQVIPSA